MRIRNPSFVLPNQARINTLKGKLNAFFAVNTGAEYLDFDKVRADVGPANLTDGEISQAAQDLDLTIG